MKSMKFPLALIFLFSFFSSNAKNSTDPELSSQKEKISQQLEANIASSHALFERNDGQYEGDFEYRFSSNSACVDFYTNKIFFSIRKVKRDFNPKKLEEPMLFEYVSWEIELLNSKATNIQNVGNLKTLNVNYFDKNANVIKKKTAEEIIYTNVYDDIDLKFYKNEKGELKYDFVLHQGASLSDIQLRYNNVKNLKVGKDGGLSYKTEWGKVKEESPFSYKTSDEQEITIEYDVTDDILSFKADFDQVDEEIILDPIYVDWSSYFYGSGSTSQTWSYTWVYDLDIDDEDNLYVAGLTNDNFPGTNNSYSSSPNGFYDAFVCKMSPKGDSIIWFSYLGGDNYEYCFTLGVNSDKEPVVAGFTRSTDFPITPNAYDETGNIGSGFSWRYAGYVTKFSKNGDQLIFSTYLGGSGSELIQSLVLDDAGDIYLTGQTNSADYPTTVGAYQTTYNGSSTTSWWNGGDAFLTKMKADGTDLIFSTFLGGPGDDVGYQVAVSPKNDIYVVGKTSSSGFPRTPGSRIFNSGLNGLTDGFITKFEPNGKKLGYSKLMGGSGEDWFEGVYINERDEAYVAGISKSSNFYTSANAYQKNSRGGADIVVLKLNPGGQNVYYSTYLGGGADEQYYSGWIYNSNVRIAANVREEAIICGITRSTDFPVTSDALMLTNPSTQGTNTWWNTAATISKLDYTGSKLLYGTYYGGSSFEVPGANKLKRISCYTTILYGGFTASSDYPTTVGVFKENKQTNTTGTYWTGFISKFRDTLFTDEIQLALDDTIVECDNVFEILDAKNIGADIVWNDGVTDNARFALDIGTYWVQATYGCDTVRDTIHFLLDYSPKLPVLPVDSTYCDQFPTIDLSAYNDTVDAVFEWNTGSTDSAIQISDSGTYWVDIITPNCGTERDVVKFDFKKTPSPSFEDSTFCDNVAMTLMAGDSLINEESYSWSTGDSSSSIYIDTTGFYKVVVSNICGSDSSTANIYMITTPEMTLPEDSVFCNDVELLLRFGKPDNDENYRITEISTGNFFIDGIDTFKITDENYYEITASNKCGSASDSIQTSMLNSPNIDLGEDDTLCDFVFYPVEIGKSNNEETYVWSDNSNLPIRVLDEAKLYWAEANNRCGTDRDSIELSLVASPIADLPADSIFCDVINITLDADNEEPSTYVWSTGASSPAITVNDEGWYKVTVSNYCGSESDSIYLSAIASPTVEIGDSLVFCNSIIPVDFEVGKLDNEEVYSWSNGTSEPTTRFSSPGKHWVQIRNKCATVSDTVEFILSNSPTVTLIPDTTLCGNFNLTLDAGNPGMNYLWMPFGDTTQTIQATEQTVYSVTVYNKYDCEASAQMEIKPDCVSKSFIPTAFSPNGDGLNDVFRPTLINFEDYKLQVYNRWGELLYESKDVKAGWDGTFRGNPVQDGVYTYIMRYKTTEDMQWQNVGGVLTILR